MFVEILNCDCEDLHWVCVSAINCKSQMVKVCDNMRTGDIPSSTKESIAIVLNCSTCNIDLVVNVVICIYQTMSP